MKLLSGLLLFCLTLTVSVRAEETAPVKKAKQELVWPEIKDPQALVSFAKSEIEAFNRNHPGLFQNIRTNLSREFDYLKSVECWLGRDRLAIILDTHPFTGQALLITPDPKAFLENHRNMLADAIDTKTPEIKFVFAEISPNATGRFEYLEMSRSSGWIFGI